MMFARRGQKHLWEIDAAAATQQTLLARCADAVRAGGVLVYVTCTLTQSENQAAVETFLQQRRDFRRVP